MMVAFNQLEEGPCALATPLQPLGWEWDYKKSFFVDIWLASNAFWSKGEVYRYEQSIFSIFNWQFFTCASLSDLICAKLYAQTH